MRNVPTPRVQFGTRVMRRPLVLALALAFGAMPLGSRAATISVTTTDDTDAVDTCTVRQAIASMNAGSVGGTNCASSGTFGTDDTINFDSATFPDGGANTITLADTPTSTLQISDAILTIDASANGQVSIQPPFIAINSFGIINDSAAGSLTLNHLTLSNATAGACGSNGGGICTSHASLTLNDSTLSGNLCAAKGGGIFSDNGSVTLHNSTLSGNMANEGGGIYSLHSTVTLTNTTLSSNVAVDAGGGINGLGGNITLNESTLSANAANNGGGILAAGVNLTLINCTLSGNSANQSGGGFYAIFGGVVVKNSTLSANTAGTSGGGIYRDLGSALSTGLFNSVLAGNTGGDANVVLSVPPSNVIGVDPQLGALANNGGPTQTMLPLVGSPAFDAGDDPSCLTTDQRGVIRPQGAHCDIGAVEGSERIFDDSFE